MVEKSDRIGGLLRYGIPDFKMEKLHIDRRIEQMQAEGVRFRTSVHVGAERASDGSQPLAVATLADGYDAIVLAPMRPQYIISFTADLVRSNLADLYNGT